jgi:hypothetical protein
MVPVTVVGRGVAVASILGMDAPRKAHPGKQVQRAVHGYEPYRLAMRPGSRVNFGRARVSLVLKQGTDHRPPRLRNAVASQTESIQDVVFTQHDRK